MLHIIKCSNDSLSSFLKTTLLFGNVSSDILDRISDAAKLSTYSSTQSIWHPGDIANQYTIIKRGMVQICLPSSSGDKSALNIYGARECIGLHAVLGPKKYPANAIAMSDVVELFQVESRLVEELTKNSIEFANAKADTLVKLYFSLQDKIDIMSSCNVSERLVALFDYLVKRFGDEDEFGSVFIPVRLPRALIANLVGARIETVIRLLSQWQKRKILVSKPHGFVWNRHSFDELKFLPCPEVLEA